MYNVTILFGLVWMFSTVQVLFISVYCFTTVQCVRGLVRLKYRFNLKWKQNPKYEWIKPLPGNEREAQCCFQAEDDGTYGFGLPYEECETHHMYHLTARQQQAPVIHQRQQVKPAPASFRLVNNYFVGLKIHPDIPLYPSHFCQYGREVCITFNSKYY